MKVTIDTSWFDFMEGDSLINISMVYAAAIQYIATGEVVDLIPEQKYAFNIVKEKIDKATSSHKALSEAGKKGAKAKWTSSKANGDWAKANGLDQKANGDCEKANGDLQKANGQEAKANGLEEIKEDSPFSPSPLGFPTPLPLSLTPIIPLEESESISASACEAKEKKLPEPCEIWNSLSLPSLPRVRSCDGARLQKSRLRWREWMARGNPTELFSQIVEAINESDFLTGRSGEWMCSYDWIMANSNNWQKVIEGNYKNKDNGNNNRQTDYRRDLQPSPTYRGTLESYLDGAFADGGNTGAGI